MSAESVAERPVAFNKTPIERDQGGEMGHHLGLFAWGDQTGRHEQSSKQHDCEDDFDRR